MYSANFKGLISYVFRRQAERSDSEGIDSGAIDKIITAVLVYNNCAPPIFLTLSGSQDSGMERYSSPKLVVEINSYYLPRMALKILQKIFFFSKYFESHNNF